MSRKAKSTVIINAKSAALAHRDGTFTVPSLGNDVSFKIKSISGRALGDFNKAAAIEGVENQVPVICDQLSRLVMDNDGVPVFTIDELMDAPVDNVLAIFRAIADHYSSSVGNVPSESEEITSSGSPTN
jgi:hypothetical protein